MGDAVEVKDWVTGSQSLVPLAGPANRQGRIAADVIMGRCGAALYCLVLPALYCLDLIRRAFPSDAWPSLPFACVTHGRHGPATDRPFDAVLT